MSKAVTVKDENAVATSDLWSRMSNVEQPEQIDARDVVVPRLRVIQSNSPQVKEEKPEYIAEARPGYLIETGANTIYNGKTGVEILRVGYRLTHLEWVKRGQGEGGGGFVADHGRDPDAKALGWISNPERPMQLMSKDGKNIINQTMEYLVLVVEEDGGLHPVLFDLTSTQLKKGRNWNTQAASIVATRPDGVKFRAPPFFKSYRVTTIAEKNNDGDWYGVRIMPERNLMDTPHAAEWLATCEDYVRRWNDGEFTTMRAMEPSSATQAPF